MRSIFPDFFNKMTGDLPESSGRGCGESFDTEFEAGADGM